MKKIIIASTSNETPLLTDLLETISKECEIYSIFTQKQCKSFSTLAISKARNFAFAKTLQKNNIIFVILWPLLSFWYYFMFYRIKRRQVINSLILTGWPEKIIMTWPAKILKMKIVWLEIPGFDYQALCPLKRLLYRLSAKSARLVAFNDQQIAKIQAARISDDITKVFYGIKATNFNRQESIFDELAVKKSAIKEKKYFSIGAACDFNENQNIELLLHAIKECLACIPHLQLIIIGDGPEKKNIQWMARKLEIENLVWFVGEQGQLKKWLENLDLFVAPIHFATLADIQKILLAQWNELPIISFDQIRLDDYINEKNGMLVYPESGDLAKNIINLYNDKILYKKLSLGAKENILKNHQIDEMAKAILAV